MSGNKLNDGTRYYMQDCQGCTVEKLHGNRNAIKKPWHYPGREYKRHRKDHCEECGFIAKHICQLDVDHIDGNKKNNHINNLKTLCANCHRLKTHQNKDSYSLNTRLLKQSHEHLKGAA